MSRRARGTGDALELFCAQHLKEQLQQQASDSYAVMRTKELLCELWKEGRITAEARFMGENVLSAALHALENPSLAKLGTTHGAKLANAQWHREQERNHEPF